MATHPSILDVQGVIDACATCIRECGRCEDHCIRSQDPAVYDCIKRCQDAADACLEVMRFLSRDSDSAPEISAVCQRLCDACAKECEKHRECEECLRCAEACRNAAVACGRLSSASV